MKFNETEFKSDRGIDPDTDYFGFKLRLRRYYYDHGTVREILQGDFYKLPSNPKIVIDIGANIGLVALLMARAGAEVYAFEPELYNYETLCHNVEINGYQDKIHCIKEGVGNREMTKLYVNPVASGATSFYMGNGGLEVDKYQIVSSVTIRDVFDKYKIEHCDLLKLDCEGAEKDIINDFDDDLASKVDQISVEIHDKVEGQKLIDKLKQWYGTECTYMKKKRNNHIWVFKKI